MPFYKPVNPGDTVTHSAGRENAISQVLGQLHAISAPRTARPAGVARQPVAEYNGYFKIIDASTYNEDGTLAESKIKIVDGATYDEETGISGTSRCRVNNVTYYISTYTSDSLSGDSVFALKYTPKVYADSSTGTEFQPDKVEIVNLTSEGIEGLPDDTAEACWYQLGRVFISNGHVEIQQDHLSKAGNGIPQIFWFDLCDG